MKKRFYKNATVIPGQRGDGFAIALDGKQIKTPAGYPFVVPAKALAVIIVEEWNGQGDEIVPSTMALTQIASTAIDRVSETRSEVIDGALGYAKTDLLCHHADGATQPELASRQRANWQPLLDWASSELGAKLIPTSGIIPVEQSDQATKAFRVEIEKMDLFSLTAFALLVGTCGSLVLAMAMFNGHINAEQTFELSMLDSTYQAENWGHDWEAKERSDNIKAEIQDVEKFITALRAK